jgi:hypothetical protein
MLSSGDSYSCLAFFFPVDNQAGKSFISYITAKVTFTFLLSIMAFNQ